MIAEARVGVKAIVTGELQFPLIVAATGPDSDSRTRSRQANKWQATMPFPSGRSSGTFSLQIGIAWMQRG